MRERVRLVPRDGARILWPAGSPKAGRVLLAAGEEVTLDPYWHARIADGGVLVATPEIPAPAPVPAPKKGKE
jgi:hypothetical protein